MKFASDHVKYATFEVKPEYPSPFGALSDYLEMGTVCRGRTRVRKPNQGPVPKTKTFIGSEFECRE